MAFLVLLVLLLLVIFAVLWSGSLLLQSYLYQSAADNLPIRAAAGATALAAFLTFWCYLDSGSGGKYDTLFEFTPDETTDYDNFDTVMKKADGDEVTVHYTKRNLPKGLTTDFFDDRGQPWRRNTSDSMAVAMLIHEKDKSEPTRFNANLDKNGNFPSNLNELRYTDDSGRYISADALGRVVHTRVGLLLANLCLSLFQLILWWVALWFGMRFTFWHSCGLALAIWLFTMAIIQPALLAQIGA